MGSTEVTRTLFERCCGLAGMTVGARKEVRRNGVRIVATHLAAIYLFLVGPLLVLLLFFFRVSAEEDFAPGIVAAKDLYLAILPVSAGIVAYWSGSRGNPK